MNGVRAFSGSVLACLLAAAVAHAQEPPPPSGTRPAPALLVRAPACESARYDTAAFLRLLTVELGALGVGVEVLDEQSANEKLSSAPALVTVECAPAPGALVLRLDDMITRKELSRETQVTDVPEEARPRALALAVVALVESSWSEAAGAQASANGELPPEVRARVAARLAHRLSAPSPAPEPPASDSVPASSRGPTFEASAALRTFPGRGTGLVGLRWSALASIAARVRLALDLEALWGRSELADAIGSIGTMDLYWLNAGTGIAWRAGTGPFVDLGPRVQLGYAHADAHTDRPGAEAHDEGGFVLSALASASLHLGDPTGPWATLGLDLGYTPVGVVFLGDQARLSGMADTTLAPRIGVAW